MRDTASKQKGNSMSIVKAMIKVIGFLGALIIAPFTTCTVQRNLDELLGPESAKTIYEPGGDIPAKEALVKVFDACSGNGKPVAVYITDENGRFSLSKIPEGMYTLWAEKDSFVMFQDSVVVTSGQTTLRDDTLERPSTITGVVGLQNYHDTRSVTVKVAGIDLPVVFADGNGRFTVKGLASGRWTLILKSSILEYLPTEKMISVGAGANDRIADTLQLSFSGIPIVSGIRFSQDTLAGTIKLFWNKPAYKIIRDFLIYHDSCMGIVYSKAPAYITEDTVCIDSIYFRLRIDSLDTVQRCLIYRIAIRNTVPKIGAFCSTVEVPFAPKSYATTFMSHNVIYANDTCDSASVGDTVGIIVTAQNRTRPLRMLHWYYPLKNDTIFSRTAGDLRTKKFVDTIRYAFDAAGSNRLQAIVTDGAGVKWFDTVRVNIIRNTVTAKAGAADTFVYSTDSMYLHGEAQSRFGKISKWEWKIGRGPWSPTSGPDTIVAASSFKDAVTCSLAVTDEDGNRAVAGVTIHVFSVFNGKIVKIAVGGQHNLFLDENSILYGRGINSSGQLGSMTVQDWQEWKLVMTGVQSMDAGDSFSLFLKTDGTLWACGSNTHGQLGDGMTIAKYDPVKIQSDVRSVAAGSSHSLILKNDGSLWACGSNQYGQLGDSSTTDRTLPVRVMNDVMSMKAGGSHSLILRTDGSLWACGANRYGQLGDGTSRNRAFPVKVTTEVRSMDAGVSHSMIIKTDGSLWACGLNFSGQLGDKTTINRFTPVQVMTNIKDIALGDYHSAILQTDNTLWSCGDNSSGQVGDSTWTCRLMPVKVMSTIRSVSAGGLGTIVIQQSGTLWIFGWISYDANSYGGVVISPIPERLIIPER
jgi:alpha-tubulin suppressor-like RCC1 family protein